jgi:hypothetical protein
VSTLTAGREIQTMTKEGDGVISKKSTVKAGDNTICCCKL